MSASDFMYFTLGFIFYKYLSEKIEMYIDGELEADEMTFKEAWASDEQELKDEIREISMENLGYFIEPDVLPLLRRVLAEGKGKDDVAVDRPLVLLHQHDRKVRGAEELPVVRSEQHSCADACRYRVLDDEIVGA